MTVRIGDLYSKLKGSAITASRMKELACSDGNVRIFSGGATIVDVKVSELTDANIYRVPAVVVQAFGVINVQYVENRLFTFRESFWAYTHERRELVEYLYFFLESKLEVLRYKASIRSIPKITAKDVDDVEISIPPDVASVASRLKSLSSSIDPDGNLAARIRQVHASYEAVRENCFAALERRRP